MTEQQQHAYDQYIKSMHLQKRLQPEHYEMFDVPQRLLRLDIAEKLLSDNGLLDQYMSLIDFVNSVHEASQHETN